MSDPKYVPVTEDNAVLLLDAAQSLGQDLEVVRLHTEGLTAPSEVFDKAFPPSTTPSKSSRKTPTPGTDKE